MGALVLKIIALELKINAMKLNVEISARDAFIYRKKCLNFNVNIRGIY